MSYLHSSSTLLRLPAGHQWFRRRVASRRVPFSQSLLALVIPMMLSGAIPIISLHERFVMWGIWVSMWVLIIRCGFMLRAKQFPKPARLLIGWVFLCCLWGVIASPVPVFDQMLRSLFYTVTAAAALTVLGSDPDAWRRMAVLAGCVIMFNFAVILASFYVPGVGDWLLAHDVADMELQQKGERFAGLWVNPNAAGLMTIMLMVLSSWAPGRAIWAARAAGVWIIYLTASRSSTYVLLLVGAIYLFNTLKSYRYGRLLALALGFLALVGVFGGLDSVVEWMSTNFAGTAFWKRISDPLERADQGGARIVILREWLPYLARAPWYGYGLNAMAGAGYESHIGISFRNDLPIAGIHNMYLGMWIDAGFLGFASYLALLGLGLVAALKARLRSLDRTALFSFWTILLAINICVHSTHMSMDGQILHLLAFILPVLPIFRHPGLFQKAIAPRGSGVSRMFKKDH